MDHTALVEAGIRHDTVLRHFEKLDRSLLTPITVLMCFTPPKDRHGPMWRECRVYI